MGLDLAAGLKIPIQHALAVQFQDPALGVPAHDGPAHLGRICTGFFSENQSLGNGLQRQADDDLIGGFGHLAGPMIADVIDIFAQFLKYRQHALEDFRSANGNCAIA